MDLIAIDGLAGSGKSTIAARLAKRLGINHLDTGASFRMAALLSIREGIAPDDEESIAAALSTCKMEYENGKSILNDIDVSELIRSEDVSSIASQIAIHASVRNYLKEWQRRWVSNHGVSVVEGRDIGSVVFPDAKLKIYLEADSLVRATRRQETTKLNVEIRDARDLTRKNAPALKSKDALVIDTTNLDIEEVEELIVRRWQPR